MEDIQHGLTELMIFLFQIVYEGPHLDHPYGLAYFGGLVYWTEFQKGTVHSKNLSKAEGSVETLSEEFSALFEIRVFDNASQTGDAQFLTKQVNNHIILNIMEV
jgi:hypothetical protein